MSVPGGIVDDLVKFLTSDCRSDIKGAACLTAAQLTGTDEGLQLLSSRPDALSGVLGLIHHADTSISLNAMKTVVNVSAEEMGAMALINVEDPEVVREMVKCIENSEYPHADLACGVLANLSKPRPLCLKVLERLNTHLEGLVKILCDVKYNKKGAKLNLLAAVITNLSQLQEGRRQIVDKDGFVLHRLLPFISCGESRERRYSAVATLHNCCFDKDSHEWLLGEDVEVAGRLLLPLAGPDTFTDEENDKLPIDLQYLPDDKTREQDPQIRKLLLEALMQLCVTRHGRERLREQNTYLILREHHKWEQDRHCIMINEDLVNLLIRTEDEIGVDDLSCMDVPDDLAKKFKSQDEEYLAGANT